VISGVAWLVRWTSRRLGLHNLLMLMLLAAVVISVVVGVVRAVGGLEVFLMVVVALLSMVVGWWLASTSLSSWKAGILIFVLGFVGLFLRVGRLEDELVALLSASIDWLGDVLPRLLVLVVLQRPPESFVVNWMPIVSALTGLWSAYIRGCRRWQQVSQP
jgi:hypothetical protein